MKQNVFKMSFKSRCVHYFSNVTNSDCIKPQNPGTLQIMSRIPNVRVMSPPSTVSCTDDRVKSFTSAPAESSILVSVCRIYQQMENLGLFLFNDTLVVTTRTNSHVPFERCVELVYTFDTCAVLSRLRLEDIPDSKC